MTYGLDFLGGVCYKEFILRVERHIPIGIFANTFGDASKFVEKLAKIGFKTFRIQLTWAGDHVYDLAENTLALREAVKYERIKQKYPDIKMYLSPFCEHRLQKPDIYLDKIAKVAPSCTIVNSTIPGGKFSTKYMNEVHGNDKRIPPGKYIYSYDGTSCVDSDITKMKVTHSKAEIFFFWVPQFNGRANCKAPHEEGYDSTPIAQRKAWPTYELINSIIFLFNARGNTSLPKNCLWKSHSEQTHNQSLLKEPRACKPVYISPFKVKVIRLKDMNGNEIAESSLPLDYIDGRFRYYFKEFGFKYYKLGNIALFEDGKQVGVINPGFRIGTTK